METAKVDELGHALRAGRITADTFLRATRPYWATIAHKIYRRWRKKLPDWAGPEDVEQEFLLLVVENIRFWQPGGMPLVPFIVWSSTQRTQRAIHRMRGARIHGNEGKNKSRPETTFSRIAAKRMNRDPDARDFDPADMARIEPRQVDDMIVGEVFEMAIGRAKTTREALVLAALRENRGEPDCAAQDLYEEFATRVECGFVDVEHARRVVGSVVSDVVRRYVSAA